MAERLDRRAVEEKSQTCGMPVVTEDVDARCSHLQRGWYWGSQEFAGKLRELSEKRTNAKKRSSRASQRTPQATAHGEEQAKQWLKGGSGTRRQGLATHERIRSAKAGPRGAALETDHGLARMDRAKTRDA